MTFSGDKKKQQCGFIGNKKDIGLRKKTICQEKKNETNDEANKGLDSQKILNTEKNLSKHIKEDQVVMTPARAPLTLNQTFIKTEKESFIIRRNEKAHGAGPQQNLNAHITKSIIIKPPVRRRLFAAELKNIAVNSEKIGKMEIKKDEQNQVQKLERGERIFMVLDTPTYPHIHAPEPSFMGALSLPIFLSLSLLELLSKKS